MNHKEDENLDRLFMAARGCKPDTAKLENQFEIRLMANIRERNSERSRWLSWMWRLAPAFTILAAILGIVTLLTDSYPSPDILTSIVSSHENHLIMGYLTGG
jgi:flagellar motor component MotA